MKNLWFQFFLKKLKVLILVWFLKKNLNSGSSSTKKKTSLFISLCILRDLLEQKILSELCSGGDPAIFLRSHVLMEKFYDGTDQENLKTQEGKNGGKKKKRFFFFLKTYLEVPILVYSPSVSQEHPWATALVQPSLRRTHLYGNLPYNNVIVGSNRC
jgi:hypothetical protein